MIRSGISALRVSAAAVLVLGIGCTEAVTPDPSTGNALLGITDFVTEELGDRTSVIGFDQGGQEIGRLDLVHGVFALSPGFAEDYATPTVDGRKLDVSVLGQKLVFETAGYDPLMQMPAHPPSQVSLAAFLEDPQVKPVLDRWQLGFEPFQGALGLEETEYTTGTLPGSPVVACGESDCGNPTGFGTINMCGGYDLAFMGGRVWQTGLPTGPEWKVAQCCFPSGPHPDNDWFAIKACPNDASSSCGQLGTGPCKGCAHYDAGGYCVVQNYTSKIDYEYY